MTRYLLHVDSIVPEGMVPAYEGAVETFLKEDGFKRLAKNADYELEFVLRSEPFEYVPPRPAMHLQTTRNSESPMLLQSCDHEECALEHNNKRVRRYVNVWRLADDDDLKLAETMIAYQDDATYNAINRAIVDEEQHLVRAVARDRGFDRLRSKGKVFRVRRRFQSEDVGRYLFRMGLLFSHLRGQGWGLLGQHQSLTGPLNVFTEFWQSPSDETSIQDALEQSRKELERREAGFEGGYFAGISPDMVSVQEFAPKEYTGHSIGDGGGPPAVPPGDGGQWEQAVGVAG